MASLVKVAQKKYTGADMCRDTKGKRYDIKEFREKRNKAVLKGMKYMKKYLPLSNKWLLHPYSFILWIEWDLPYFRVS